MAMTLAMRILKLLADGKLRSVEAIATELGAEPGNVRNSISWLRLKGMLTSEFMYAITPQGAERAKFKAKRVRVRIRRPVDHKEAEEAEDAALQLVQKIVAAPAVADSIVSTAVQSRPALQAAWGAMA